MADRLKVMRRDASVDIKLKFARFLNAIPRITTLARFMTRLRKVIGKYDNQLHEHLRDYFTVGLDGLAAFLYASSRSHAEKINLMNSEKPFKLPAVPAQTGSPVVNPHIFELENRKKKTGLAHEFGAGAACKKCGTACPGLDLHYWRKICKACKCPKEEHDVPPDDNDPGQIRIGRLFDRPLRSLAEEAQFTISSNSVTDKGAVNGSNKPASFDWVPHNTTAKLVEKYMTMLPDENKPIAASEGAIWRRKALERQLPMHDMEPQHCHDLTDAEEKQLHNYVHMMKTQAAGLGQVQESPPTEAPQWKCNKCQQGMHKGDVAVFAERAGADVCWHPACFRCSKCDELLADLIYFWKDGHLLCGRHFGESVVPRCAGCDELIFAREYTQAEGQSFHLKHFCCFECDKPLGGHRYMSRDDHPYCLDCYKEKFARTCQRCQQKIEADVQRVSHHEFHWHATCFICETCDKSLLDSKFVFKAGHVYCSIQCKQNAKQKMEP